MNRWFPREVLRFVDAWACREGTPEDHEDVRNRLNYYDVHDGDARCDRGRCRDGDSCSGGIRSMHSSDETPGMPKSAPDNEDPWIGYEHENGVAREWIELDVRLHTDEETGQGTGRNHCAS